MGDSGKRANEGSRKGIGVGHCAGSSSMNRLEVDLNIVFMG